MNTRVYGAQRFKNLIIYSMSGHTDCIVNSFFENNSLDVSLTTIDGKLLIHCAPDCLKENLKCWGYFHIHFLKDDFSESSVRDYSWKNYVTHCGLVMPYGDIDLGQHWHRLRFVAWWHQAITWINVNSLGPGRFEWNFRWVILKQILLIDSCGYLLSNYSKINVTIVPTNEKSTLAQVMAWCHQTASHCLSQCWPRSMSPYGVTRPQWVKLSPVMFCGLYLWEFLQEMPKTFITGILTIPRLKYGIWWTLLELPSWYLHDC